MDICDNTTIPNVVVQPFWHCIQLQRMRKLHTLTDERKRKSFFFLSQGGSLAQFYVIEVGAKTSLAEKRLLVIFECSHGFMLIGHIGLEYTHTTSPVYNRVLLLTLRLKNFFFCIDLNFTEIHYRKEIVGPNIGRRTNVASFIGIFFLFLQHFRNATN